MSTPGSNREESQESSPPLRCNRKHPAPPDGGWGWWVVFGSFMIHVITDGITYSFGVFYAEFLVYFKAGQGATSWILSILVGVTFCSGPISSLLVNRFGCRIVTIAGAILAAGSLAVSIWAPNVVTLYVTIGLGTGLGFGLIYLPAIISVSSYFEKKRSLATGIAVCGSGFGTFVFAPLITTLLAEFTWQISLLIVSGTVVSCVFFGLLFRPLQDEQDSQNEETEESEEDTTLSLRSVEGQLNLKIGSSYNNVYLDVGRRRRDLHLAGDDVARSKSSSDLPTYGTIATNLLLGSTRSDGPRSRRILDQKDLFFTRSIHSLQGSSEPILAVAAGPQKVKPCVEDMKETFVQLLDVKLLTDPVFILFAASNFLTSIGFNVPYVHLVSRAKSLGLSANNAGMLLSIIGIANTVGRIVLGYLSDMEWVNRLQVYNTCLTICGITTALSCLCTDFYSLIVFSSVFGFMIGAYVGLTSVILVDLLGLDKLTNAFGLLLLFQGLASFLGPPIAGWMFDVLHSYDPGFMVAGISIAISGIILFVIPCIQRRRLHTSTCATEVYL